MMLGIQAGVRHPLPLVQGVGQHRQLAAFAQPGHTQQILPAAGKPGSPAISRTASRRCWKVDGRIRRWRQTICRWWWSWSSDGCEEEQSVAG
jgi:hypothetical protein